MRDPDTDERWREANVRTATAFVDAWRRRDLHAIGACVSADFQYHASIGAGPGQLYAGREAALEGIASMWSEDEGCEAVVTDRCIVANWGYQCWTYRWAPGPLQRPEECGCDLLQFRDGLLIRKDAYRKLRRAPAPPRHRGALPSIAEGACARTRYADPRDARDLLVLMKQLAVFEGYADRFRVEEADLLERGLCATDTGVQPQFTAIVAEEASGGLAGYAAVYEIPFTYDLKPTLVLKELFVSASTRDSGIGSALLHAVLHHAKSRGCGRLKWDVLPSNDKAKAFYRRFGAARDMSWENWTLQLGGSGDRETAPPP